jgi:NADPH-dependent 2,4-dienoyl-CoA reductase/sulfur reductase-like enzyme/rhodanese-related sulfurtransferase
MMDQSANPENDQFPSEVKGTEPWKKRLVIIGAVAAGTSAAAKARRNDENLDIVLYDMDEHISYSGCGLPYYISGRVKSMAELTPRDPEFFWSRYRVRVLIRHQVMSVDPAARTLLVKDLATGETFSDHYDTLVLATGAKPVVPDLPGIASSHVFTLRNPSNALAIRRFIEERHPARGVIIGSGYIGLEMVESLSECGISLTVVEKMPQVCPWLDPDMAVHLAKYLDEKNIHVITGHAAAAIEPDAVILDDGSRLVSGLVILAAGIRPNTELARLCGIRLGPTGAIAVNNQMQTSDPGIYACGDCAESFSIVDGQPLYHALGTTANKTGRIAGDIIGGGCLAFRGVAGTGIFKVFDMTVATCGLKEQNARNCGFDVLASHTVKPDKSEYFGGKDMVIKTIVDRKTEKLLGVQIVGFAGVDKRMDVLVTAMTAGMRAPELEHLDLAYAPPFATTRDPVLYAGMILDDALHRGRELILAGDLLAASPESVQVVDARTSSQFQAGHIEHAVNMPHASLREQADQLDKDKPVVTYCNGGVTGNAAQNILLNHGFRKVYNLSGGFRQYKAVKPKVKKPEKT